MLTRLQEEEEKERAKIDGLGSYNFLSGVSDFVKSMMGSESSSSQAGDNERADVKGLRPIGYM